MKIKELTQKNQKELQELLKDSRNKLRDLRFKAASNQLKNVREMRKLRRLIARLMFVLKQGRSRARSLEANEQQGDQGNKLINKK